MKPYFSCKQFKVRHDQSTMKVGTDALLLATLGYMPTHAKKVLEIGCGCGIISLVWKQRFLHAKITAIDIHEPSVEQAQHNFALSPWAHDMEVLQRSLQQHAAEHAEQPYDCIISNPPFFEHDMKSLCHKRNLARHNDNLPFSALLQSVSRLLAPHGVCNLVLPAAEGRRLIAMAAQCHLFVVGLRRVYPHTNKTYNRLIISLAKCNKACEYSDFYIRQEDNNYTEAYRHLMSPFLLSI